LCSVLKEGKGMLHTSEQEKVQSREPGAGKSQLRASALLAMIVRPHNRPLIAVALLGLFLIASFSVSLAKPRAYNHLIVGDGIGYYVWLRSAVIDGDLDFRNEYAHFNALKAAVSGLEERPTSLSPTPTGLAHNNFAAGSALLWLPFFLVVHLPLRLAQALGFPVVADGYQFAYDIAICLGSAVYATLGAGLTYLWLRRAFAAHFPHVAIWPVLVVWLSSPLYWYAAFNGSMAHANSAFTVALFLYTWVRGAGERGWQRWAWMGAALGLAGLTRWQDLMWGIVLLPALWQTWRVEGAARLAASLAALVGATLLVFSPQMVGWQILYGNPLTVPQGDGFLQWAHPHLLEVLFSPRNGLFVWSPVALLSVAGLFLALRRYPAQAGVLLIALLAQVYLNSITLDWWGGTSIGARRLASSFPALTFGLTYIWNWAASRRLLSRLAAGVGLALVAWNMLFVAQVVLHTVPITHPETLTYAQAFGDKLTLIRDVVRQVLVRGKG
jgi:hypothetical protein